MKLTAANAEKEAIGWSLSWKPDGRSDTFTREAILACAPPTSGVYGLFNFDCQVFIGESANIQEALLRHMSETDFQSQHLRATGFTFEPCAAELRKHRAYELIARFRPLLQTEAALTEIPLPSNGSMPSEVVAGDQELGSCGDHQEFPVHERAKDPQVHRRFQFKRKAAVAVATALIASAVVIFYLVKIAADNTQKRVDGAKEKPLARISITQAPASGKAGNGAKPRDLSSITAAGARVKPHSEQTPARPDGAVRFATTKASAADEAGVRALLGPAKTIPTADSSGSANLSKKWSVQISASPAKDTANHLVQQLIAKGYDGYVVPAEVKGQTYYRVRVGHFASRETAESMRQSLANQEGYRDAYLTGD